MTYAANTTVTVERTRAEIEQLLIRYGADQFASGWDAGHSMIACRMQGRHLKFTLTLPDNEDPEFTLTKERRYKRSASEARRLWEQACRSRWRALYLVVKAKLEAIEVGISTFDEEFMAHILLPDGKRFGTWAAPQIESAYGTGNMPPLLPAGQLE